MRMTFGRSEKTAIGSLLLIAVVCGLSGCGEGASAEVLALRQQFLTQQPLEGQQPMPKIRELLKSGELDSNTPIVVRARINAGDMPPWGTGTASFVVTDATGHDGDQEHDPHQCPFCSRNIQESMAQIHFHGSNGNLLQTDSRELFDLKENQLVFVQGTATIDESDTLVIIANRMYVQK